MGKVKKKTLVSKPSKLQYSASLLLYTNNFILFSDKVLPEELVRLITEDFILWCEKPSSLVIEVFFNQLRISPSYVNTLLKRFPWFKQAMELGKSIIGARRETLGLYNKINPNLVLMTAPLYNNKYKEYLRWKNVQKDENGDTKIVVMEKFPDKSQLVELETEND